MPRKLQRTVSDLKKRAGLDRVPDGVLYVGVILVGVLIALAAWRWWPHQLGVSMDVGAARLLSSRPAPVVDVEPIDTQPDASSIAVHIVGAVSSPGLYEIEQGSRLSDAIKAAGGPNADAALDAVNLAAVLTDGSRIEVPTKAQVEAGEYSPQSSALGATSQPVKVDINSADAGLLETLPGIGPSTAEKIIADRTQNGRFSAPEDLMRVSGIGEKKYESLKDLIVVR